MKSSEKINEFFSIYLTFSHCILGNKDISSYCEGIKNWECMWYQY